MMDQTREEKFDFSREGRAMHSQSLIIHSTTVLLRRCCIVGRKGICIKKSRNTANENQEAISTEDFLDPLDPLGLLP